MKNNNKNIMRYIAQEKKRAKRQLQQKNKIHP
jgi:hypothetical protein